MRSASQLREEIAKCEAKAAKCKFPSTKAQWEEKAAFLRGELRLQLLYENAGKPKPEAHPMDDATDGVCFTTPPKRRKAPSRNTLQVVPPPAIMIEPEPVLDIPAVDPAHGLTRWSERWAYDVLVQHQRLSLKEMLNACWVFVLLIFSGYMSGSVAGWILILSYALHIIARKGNK